MNINDYRRGMDHIAPAPELKERIMNNSSPRKHVPVRRAVNLLLAAALALACLCTVALAASPELRTAVLSFFRMEEREQVPNSSANPEGPDISQAEIGQLVKAQYVRLDDYGYGFSGGLVNYLTWSNDFQTLLDAKFWEIKGNEMVPVEVDLKTAPIDITFKGIHYQGEFWWFVRDGQLCYFTGENNYRYDENSKAGRPLWQLNSIPDRTDAVLLYLNRGGWTDLASYPFLYHLDTGEAEDILAGTGVDELEHCANPYIWREDMRRVLIQSGSGLDEDMNWNVDTLLCNLDDGTLVKLDELAGLEASLTFLEGNTLLVYDCTRNEEGVVQELATYTYDISTGHLDLLLDWSPNYISKREGLFCLEYGVCLDISKTGQVQLIDLRTGERTPIEGFTFQDGDDFMPNSSGTKLLYYSPDYSIDRGLGISKLGVIDLEARTFIAFDREGYEKLDEYTIDWYDDNTVGIRAQTQDGETYYMLLYQF
ncbi:hypothetical protein D1646_01105 [Pseudoflavonifractor sp. 60]|uniref:hypothetical protein n=1 Tax=Pseudoflavonifractor sp. 60 TaxID=2304576 RepID=UPI00137145C2|nr:hypothetical protein [Pseudoflavonifractor sp. 60]NBI65424.1 hypothetical protein [Pseudoflavonifractor sp. 60]